jgi:hypothetical protein
MEQTQVDRLIADQDHHLRLVSGIYDMLKSARQMAGDTDVQAGVFARDAIHNLTEQLTARGEHIVRGTDLWRESIKIVRAMEIP